MKMRDENQALLSGDIPAGFIQTHEEYGGKKMYTGYMTVFKNNNRTFDIITVVIPEEMYKKGTDYVVSVIGEMRSRVKEGTRRKVNYVKVLDLKYLDNPEEKDSNEVYLVGFLVKNPIATKITQNGEWVYSKIILRVPRGNRSDTIACTMRNENAEISKTLIPGQRLKIKGTFKSYEKWIDELQEKIDAIEVLVENLEVL